MPNPPIISPSILSADFANLGQEVNAVLTAGADAIHFDVMDHHFVPNLTFGAPICSALRKYGITAFIDAHLMVSSPEHFIDEFAKAGANLLTFHPETTHDVDATIDRILDSGMQAGLAFNPDKPIAITPQQYEKISMLLIMSVFPGFGGQSFITSSLDKIKTTRVLLDQYNPNCYLGVDGGIKIENIQLIAEAGANFFVVGSGLFEADNYQTRIAKLRNAITKGTGSC